jgi:hypothetical protein
MNQEMKKNRGLDKGNAREELPARTQGLLALSLAPELTRQDK